MSKRSTWRVVFVNDDAAEKYLERRGFSVGRLERDEPRGVLFGDFDIQKWRNLRPADRAGLHGVMQRTLRGPDSPAAITIFASAPEAAHVAIRQREPLPEATP